MRNRKLQAILLLPLASWFLSACEQEPPPLVEQIRAIKTITVTEIASGQTRKYSGVTQATDRSALSFQVAGNVKTVKVKLGDRVKKGQLLAALDKKRYKLDVQAAQAGVQRAKAGQNEKKLHYARQKKLFDKTWVSKAALDQAIASYESAKSEVNYATSKLNLAKRDLANTVLVAPFSGVIANRKVDPHVEVRAGQKLFEINAEGALEIAFDIPETTVSRIAIGMPVAVSFSTDKACRCQGRITEIGSVAGTANAFPVKAGLIDPPASILAGMTAELTIVLEEAETEAAYLVPLAALAPGKEPGSGFVFVYDPATSAVRRTPVKGSGATDNMIAITQGVKAGDIIAVAGVSFLTDKQKVKLLQP